MQYCNDKYDWDTDTELLDISKFDIVNYPNSFLGSQGKKVTLAATSPDDFELLYPKYETQFHYVVYDSAVDSVGDYSVYYDMSSLGHNDYYNESSYHVCNYGDNPLTETDNLMTKNENKVLIIHDSFGDCLVPPFSLGLSEVNAIDLRHFTGSVRTYIKQTNPELVIVFYNPASIGNEINYYTHEDLFDFR